MLRAGRRAGWARQAHAVPKTHLSVRGGGILLLVCLDYPLRQREQARFFGQVRHGCVVLCSLCLQWHEGRGAGGEWLASAGTARAAHPCPLGCLPEPGDARGGGASSDGQPPGAVCRPASRAWASRRLGRGRVHGQPRVLGTVAGPVRAQEPGRFAGGETRLGLGGALTRGEDGCSGCCAVRGASARSELQRGGSVGRQGHRRQQGGWRLVRRVPRARCAGVGGRGAAAQEAVAPGQLASAASRRRRRRRRRRHARARGPRARRRRFARGGARARPHRSVTPARAEAPGDAPPLAPRGEEALEFPPEARTLCCRQAAALGLRRGLRRAGCAARPAQAQHAA